jgi:hypothetical protein
MKLPALIAAGVVALFLYWVVQDPVGAAEMIRVVWENALALLSLVAERLVEFLNALV